MEDNHLLKNMNLWCILSILLMTLTAFTGGKELETDLKQSVHSFLKALEKDFEISNERKMNSKYNDVILETKTGSVWSKTVTLKCKKAFGNNSGQVLYQRLYFGFHQFESVEESQAAFKQVMDCLGSDCQNIQWGNTKTTLKTTPFMYVRSGKNISFCKISCEHANDFWIELKDRFEEEFRGNMYQVISADCGSVVTFNENMSE